MVRNYPLTDTGLVYDILSDSWGRWSFTRNNHGTLFNGFNIVADVGRKTTMFLGDPGLPGNVYIKSRNSPNTSGVGDESWIATADFEPIPGEVITLLTVRVRSDLVQSGGLSGSLKVYFKKSRGDAWSTTTVLGSGRSEDFNMRVTGRYFAIAVQTQINSTFTYAKGIDIIEVARRGRR